VIPVVRPEKGLRGIDPADQPQADRCVLVVAKLGRQLLADQALRYGAAGRNRKD